MRRVIVQEFVTIDGLAAGPEGEVDFIPAATEGDSGLAEHQMQFIDTVDTMLLGRVTYEMFAGYWPTAAGDDKPFADKLNAKAKIVFSRTLDSAPWGSFEAATISREEPREQVARLRAEDGDDLVVWGSLSLVRTLAQAGVVDEYQLWMLPVVLGGGRTVFEGGGPIDMELLETASTERGATLLRYRPR